MTIVELLAAMAIFLGLAGMILQVLGGGLDLWSRGERSRDESEQASALLDHVSAELRHAIACDGGEGEPRVKMLCDFLSLDSDGNQRHDFRSQRLLFVRSLYEERTNVPLRNAGTKSASALVFDGTIPPGQDDFTATESRVEVAFVPQPDPRTGFEGRMVLWRALRSPIGGKESLFELARKDAGGLRGARLEPLAENVLYFGLSFVDDSVKDLDAQPDAGGPLVLWDSTRGILPAGDGYAGFRHARGAASLADPDDDVFPQAVRVVVVMCAPPGESPVAETIGDLSSAEGALHVGLRNGQYLKKLGDGAKLLRLGHEWVEVAPTDGNSLDVVKRGLLGTVATVHPDGTKVLVGRRFERVVPLACGRGDLVPRDAPRRNGP
jgi:type II secretory pathway pseudopilin PulG